MDEARQALMPDTQVFRDVFSASPIGIAVENLDGQTVFVNPAFCSMLGFGEEELCSKHFVGFSPPEDAEKDWALFQQLRTGLIDHYQLEKRYLRRDGSLFWGRLSISLLKSRPSPLVVAMVEDITDKHAVLDREHRLLETLDLVTKQMTAAVTRCNRDFRYLWANQAYAEWLQRPLDQLVGRPIFEVLGKEAFDALTPFFEQVLKGENVQYERETDFQGIGKRWVSATYTPTLNDNGAIDGWVAVVLDTTERHRTEEARFRHAAIVESYQDAIISKNLDAVITSWNVGAERIFGYTEAEAVGQPIAILIPPELRDEENKILERLRAGGRVEHYETNRVTKTGENIVVSLNIGPIKDSSGRVVGFTKIAHDITQRKRAEEAVKESEVRFRLVANTAPVMIWMAGPDKLYTYFNQPWLDFTGRPLEAELGNGWVDGIHSEDQEARLNRYAGAFDRRESFRTEYRLRRHDGQYRWVLDLGIPRLNPDGTLAGYIGSAIDVTEQKLAEDALSNVNRRLIEAHEEERTRIARELHDDINQRLALLAVNLSSLKQDVPEASTKQRIEQVRQEATDLGADVQALSHRLHSSKLEYLGLAVAAGSFCKEFSKRHNVEVDFRHDTIPRTIPSEVSLCLFRVLQEALQNAEKYSGTRRFAAKLEGTSNEIRLSVHDSGVGFDPEATINRHGLGLISMTERMRLVHGQLFIDSKPQCGTTIHARVPLKIKHAAAAG